MAEQTVEAGLANPLRSFASLLTVALGAGIQRLFPCLRGSSPLAELFSLSNGSHRRITPALDASSWKH
jgi:hypothetical protein